jgi:hypothetical protein
VLQLSINDIGVLAAGLVFIAAGVGGLVPVLLLQRSGLQDRVRIIESLNPALRAATAAMDPMPPPPALSGGVGESTAPPSGRSVAPAVIGDVPWRAATAGEVPAEEELLARLFNIRMALSDVAEEIHGLRDVYNLDDDGIVEDIDHADDDLSDIEEDEYPEKAIAKVSRRKVREVA